MSCSETSTVAIPNRAQALEQQRGRPRRSSARGPDAGRRRRGALVRQRRQPGELALELLAGQDVAVHSRGVVGLKLRSDRGGRRGGAGDGDRGAHALAQVGRQPVGDDLPRVGGEVLELACGRRVGVQVRSVIRTTPICREVKKATSPPCPTTNSVEPPPISMTTISPSSRPWVALAGRAEEGERRLLGAGDLARVDAEALTHRLGERRAVARVAHRAGQHRDRRVGPMLVDRRAVALEPAKTRCIASSASAPVASTPWPRRVTVDSR
jgi:hypothetical protein